MTSRKKKTPTSSPYKLFLTENESHSPKINLDPQHELTQLKKNLDSVKQENIKKTISLNLLTAKISELKSKADSIRSERKDFEENSFDYKAEISKASEKLTQEIELQKVYEHMLSRNKAEGTNLNIRVNYFTENVKSAKLRLDFESEKARKARDSKYSARSMLKDLKVSLDEDTKKHLSHMSNLEKNIVKRREIIRKYEERVVREKDIVELAAEYDREKHEGEYRKKIRINKMLFEILTAKEKTYHQAGKKVELCFQDIRAKTGLTDPNEILNVFMNKEKTHNQLIEEVTRAELTLDQIQNDYYKSRDELKGMLSIAEYQGTEKTEKTDQVQLAYKTLNRAKAQQKKTEAVYSEVKKWCDKMMNVLEVAQKTEELTEAARLIHEEVDKNIEKAKQESIVFEETLNRKTRTKTQDILKDIYPAALSPAKNSLKNRT